MGRVNSPGAGRQNHRRSFMVFLFFLLEKEGGRLGMFSKGKAEVVLRMAKRGGSAKKEWEIVKDDFFVGETKG